MFEGLDQIGWESIGPHVSRGGDIPESIRNLVTSDPNVRREAREFLIGPGSFNQCVGDTTPHIIPFILEVLSDPNSPDKDALLLDLSSIAEHIWHFRHLSVHRMRLYVETYDALKTGKEVFISLFDSVEISVRTGAISLLKYFTDDVEVLLSQFFRRFDIEEEEQVQVALLLGAKALLNPLTWAHYDYQFYQYLKEKYTPILKDIIETHPSPKVQIAGAKASIEILRLEGKKEYASLKVPVLLSKEFLAKSKALDILEVHSTWDEDFTEAIMLMKDLIRLDSEVLLNLLREPTITAIQAHIIFNGLLTTSMGLDYLEPFWNNDLHLDYRKRDKGIFYVNDYSLAINLRSIVNYELNHPETNFERPTLSDLYALIENDAFWKTPTNMLSFFYGLPDSREELRAILGSKSIW